MHQQDMAHVHAYVLELLCSDGARTVDVVLVEQSPHLLRTLDRLPECVQLACARRATVRREVEISMRSEVSRGQGSSPTQPGETDVRSVLFAMMMQNTPESGRGVKHRHRQGIDHERRTDTHHVPADKQRPCSPRREHERAHENIEESATTQPRQEARLHFDGAPATFLHTHAAPCVPTYAWSWVNS